MKFFNEIYYRSFYDKDLAQHLGKIKLTNDDLIYLLDKFYQNNVEAANSFFSSQIEHIMKLSYTENAKALGMLFVGCFRARLDGYPPLRENVEYILKNIQDPYYIFDHMEKKEDPKLYDLMKDYFRNHLEEVLPKVRPQNILKVMDVFQNEKEVLDQVIEYTITHFGRVVEDIRYTGLLDKEFRDKCERYPKLNKFKNNFVNANFAKIIQDIYFNYNIVDTKYSSEEENHQRKVVFEILEMIIKEICQNEKVNYEDIYLCGTGGYAMVLKVGEKVIKLGKERESMTFPNNPYIVQPLLRKTFTAGEAERKEQIFVEICEYVDTLDESKVTEEELYGLYSNMRDIGLEWMDVFPRNIGRLRRDNIVHWQRPLDPMDKALELDDKVGNTILKKGDYVILDSDFIYPTGKIPPKLEHSAFLFMGVWRKFHKRYNEEHQKEEAKESSNNAK